MNEYNFKSRKYYMGIFILYAVLGIALIVSMTAMLMSSGEFDTHVKVYLTLLIFASLLVCMVIARRSLDYWFLAREYQTFRDDLYFIEHSLAGAKAILKHSVILLDKYEEWEMANRELLSRL